MSKAVNVTRARESTAEEARTCPETRPSPPYDAFKQQNFTFTRGKEIPEILEQHEIIPSTNAPLSQWGTMLREFDNVLPLFGRAARTCHNGRDATDHFGTEFAVIDKETMVERMLIQFRLCAEG